MKQLILTFSKFANTHKREIKDIPLPDRKAYEGVEVVLHSLLSPAQNGSDWSPSGSCRFTPGEKVSPPHSTIPSQKWLVGPQYGVSAPTR